MTPDGCKWEVQERAHPKAKGQAAQTAKKARSVEGGAMEQQELYRYYSTQRPVDIGTLSQGPG